MIYVNSNCSQQLPQLTITSRVFSLVLTLYNATPRNAGTSVECLQELYAITCLLAPKLELKVPLLGFSVIAHAIQWSPVIPRS